MIYLFVIILLLFLAYIYDVCGKKNYKEQWFFFIILLFVVIAGMRYRLGVDTARYLVHFYHDTPHLKDLTWEDLQIGSDPLFHLLNSLILTMGGRFYILQFVQAVFINILVFKYIKRHTHYVFTALFFYFIWQYYGYNMEELRASMALVICLFANDYCLEKKWFKAVLLYLIATQFHFSAVICLITPLLLFLKFNLLGVAIILVSFYVSVLFAPTLEANLELLAFSDWSYGRISSYLEDEEQIQSGLNIFGYITSMIMYSYPVVALYVMKKRDGSNHLLTLEPFLVICIIVSVINLRLPVFYRFTHFYAIYFIIFVSDFCVRVAKYP